MIRYSLACDAAHRFESWFRDSRAYEDQRAARTLACPLCGSASVAKTVMAPAVVGAGRERGAARDGASAPPLLDDQARAARALLRDVRDKLVAEGCDVGPRFAQEARRMHEGEMPMRRIYGQASVGEARELIADGILVMPLPNVPDELN